MVNVMEGESEVSICGVDECVWFVVGIEKIRQCRWGVMVLWRWVAKCCDFVILKLEDGDSIIGNREFGWMEKYAKR